MAAAAVDPAVPISLHPTHTQLRPISCGSLWQQQLWTPSCPQFPSPHPHAAASYQLGQLMAVAAAVKPQLSRFLHLTHMHLRLISCGSLWTAATVDNLTPTQLRLISCGSLWQQLIIHIVSNQSFFWGVVGGGGVAGSSQPIKWENIPHERKNWFNNLIFFYF